MNKCRFCEGPVETSLRSGKPKLYCGKKCANSWHHHKSAKRYIKKNPDWGTRGERDKLIKVARALEREKKNAWIDKNCVSRAELAQILGIHEGSVWKRAKELGIKSHKKIVPAETNHKTFTFYEKSDGERIKKYKGKNKKGKRPDGFMSKPDASRFLGVTEITILTKLQRIKQKTGKYPVERKYVTDVIAGRPGTRCYYKIEDLERVKKLDIKVICVCKACKKEFKTRRKKVYCNIHCKFKEIREKHALEVKKRGLIVYKEALNRLGCSGGWSNLHKVSVKIGGRRYIKESKIEKLTKEYKKHKERKRRRPRAHVIKRKDDWQHWETREERLLKGFPAKVKRWEKRWGCGSKQIRALMRGIDANHSYHGMMKVTGEVIKFTCSNCSTLKPFYEFNFSCRGGKQGRQVSHCRQCVSDRQKARRNSALSKQKRQQNYSLRVRIQVATSIKRHISKVTGLYCYFSVPLIWQHIENACGYGHIDLVKHIESQFTPNMHWQNQKTPRIPGEFGWHLDHIVPHIKFKYDSLDHPDFIACWALENLRPLEAIMNMQKADKKLYQVFQSSFRAGIKKAEKGEIYTTGVWKHLDYGNLEAKKFLEKKFAAFEGIKWGNWGKFWQLDHIDPVAHLAYTSPECKNFKKCWNLSNLRPVPRKLNSAKGSRWDNRLWFHNY